MVIQFKEKEDLAFFLVLKRGEEPTRVKHGARCIKSKYTVRLYGQFSFQKHQRLHPSENCYLVLCSLSEKDFILASIEQI